MSYRVTLICTVGTSLKGNLQKMADQDVDVALAEHNFQALAARLLQLDPDDRICGAEVNSNHDIHRQGFLDEPHRLVLLVSDTANGMLVGQILKHYYQTGRTPLRFKEVELKTLEGLTDQDSKRFQKDGLRNLVRAIAAEARRRSAEHLIINATGGYKAQISFAGMIGQTLDIPVCYLFENFDTVISLPPQPISLDLSFWMKNAFLFYELEDCQITVNPADQEPMFETLVDTIEVDGVTLLGLSSMGQLFHETFCYRFSLQKETMVPPASGLNLEEKTIRYEKGIGLRPRLGSSNG